MNHLRLVAACLMVFSTLLAGCNVLRVTTTPMATQLDRSACTGQAKTLLVLLPGRYASIDEFVDQGFIRELRDRRIAADILRVDAHLGYYTNRSVVDRLEADVFEPARAAGYQSVWVVGISLGGLGALLHEEMKPGRVEGLVLLAPYLGEKPEAAEVEAAGGLQAWKAPVGTLPAEQLQPGLWRWLQANLAASPPSGQPPLYLGYGTEDRFVYSHRVLAAALPKDHVFTTPGGHDWLAWRNLWQQALAVLPLPVCP